MPLDSRVPCTPAPALLARLRSVRHGGSRIEKRGLNVLLKALLSNIGTCRFCIRTAFLVALASILSACIAWFIGDSLIRLLTATASLLFTALWLLHVVVFAIRSAKREFGYSQGPRLAPRREFMRSFIQAGASILALTAFGAVMNHAAFAQDNDSADSKRASDCRNAKYRCGNQCLDTYNNCMNGCRSQSGFGALQCIGQCGIDKDSCNDECQNQESDCNNS